MLDPGWLNTPINYSLFIHLLVEIMYSIDIQDVYKKNYDQTLIILLVFLPNRTLFVSDSEKNLTIKVIKVTHYLSAFYEPTRWEHVCLFTVYVYTRC